MELEKRKREEDDGGANGKRAKAEEDDNYAAARGVVPTPRDEEVEEFYAILKRIQVAVKYFEDRNGGRRLADRRDLTVKTWSPSFVPEDFEDVRKADADPAKSAEVNQNACLDLNSDPVPDVPAHSVNHGRKDA